jgi:hypothetical protein
LIETAIKVLSMACNQNQANVQYLILCNKVAPLVNLLEKTLSRPEEFHPQLLTLLTLLLWQPMESEVGYKIKVELTMYVINMCIVDKIQQRFVHLQLSRTDESIPEFLERACEFLEAITAFPSSIGARRHPVYTPADPNEFHGLIAAIVTALKDTQFVCLISLLVSFLLKSGTAKKEPVEMTQNMFNLVHTCFRMINNVANLDLVFFQSFFGMDSYQAEVCHLLTFVLAFCTAESGPSNEAFRAAKQKLMHELILTIGYYTLQNERNQEVLQWGKHPSILQRLCLLPFQYFSDAKFKGVLLPTLTAACFLNPVNLHILEQEMASDLIVGFLKEELEQVQISKTETKEKEKIPARFQLSNRFPVSLLNTAIKFFNHEQTVSHEDAKLEVEDVEEQEPKKDETVIQVEIAVDQDKKEDVKSEPKTEEPVSYHTSNWADDSD